MGTIAAAPAIEAASLVSPANPASPASDTGTTGREETPAPLADAASGTRASNDPRVNRAKRSASIETQTLDINVSAPLVADTVSAPSREVKRAPNDPRARASQNAENVAEEGA